MTFDRDAPIMTPTTIAVVGAGQRVVNDVLPVIASLPDHASLAGVFTRTPRALEVGGATVPARPLDELVERGLTGIDLVHVVVAKGAVPSVVERLARGGGARDCDLMLETPGLLYKLLGRRAVLAPWRRVFVSEDTTTLPLWDVVAGFATEHGAVDDVLLDRCGYAYHGVAMARRLLGGGHVRRARRRTADDGRDVRRFEVVRADGSVGSATVVGPRDYAASSLRVRAGQRTLGDRADADVRLAALLDGERCLGFAAGGHEERLEPAESDLMGPWSPTQGDALTPHMHGLKRIGLRRLFARHASERGGYALADGLEDMAVDWHLERFGRYRRNPLTSAHSPWPSRLLRLAGR